jgi:hypothetical protein
LWFGWRGERTTATVFAVNRLAGRQPLRGISEREQVGGEVGEYAEEASGRSVIY